MSNRAQITLEQELRWTADPTSVTAGQKVVERATGATPNGRILLYWVNPGGTALGPLEAGRADASGDFPWTWDTASAGHVGTYTSWVRDEATGRDSNRVYITIEPPTRLTWSASPTRVRRGQPVQERASGATPGSRVLLFWIPPGGSVQGPLALGTADADGALSQSWDTATAGFLGTYTSWVRDEATGRDSNRVQITVDP